LPLGVLPALATAALLSSFHSGCSDPPPTKAELDAMSAIQRAHGHVATDPTPGHAIIVDFTRVPSVRDADLAPLADLPYLEKVKFDDSPVGNDAVAPLANLKQLKALSLRGTKITDAGMVHLQKLPSLMELDLERLPLTDQGLIALGPIKTLHRVYISSKEVTSAGIDALKAQNPRVNVSRK
jgi:hypothetical protein